MREVDDNFIGILFAVVVDLVVNFAIVEFPVVLAVVVIVVDFVVVFVVFGLSIEVGNK